MRALFVLALAGLALGTTRAVSGQSPGAAVPMSQDVFKSATILRGIPVDTFMEAMGMFANSMGADCTFCHVKQAFFDRSRFAEPTPRINRARQMVVMMDAINKTYFQGERRVTCFTCHGGSDRPAREPSLALQYSAPFEDPNALDFPEDTSVTAQQVLDRYLQAVGGRDRLARVTSVTAKGKYVGYDTANAPVPVEVAARAPNQRVTRVHMLTGDSLRVFDGRNGWLAGPDTVLPLLPLTGGTLERARVEAALAFPANVTGLFSRWKVGLADVGDDTVQVLQGSSEGQPLTNLYFTEDGLLVRLVQWAPTPVGLVPTQIDYSDYRDVSGIRMPFRYTVSQTSLQSTVTFDEITLGAAVDPSLFARPAAFRAR